MTEYDDGSGGVDKITISLPRGTRAALQAMVDACRASSVSALIAQAVSPYASTAQERARTRERITQLRGGRPLPPEALTWARQALGWTPRPRARAPRDRRAGPGPDRGDGDGCR
jgi:hypothetical protein